MTVQYVYMTVNNENWPSRQKQMYTSVTDVCIWQYQHLQEGNWGVHQFYKYTMVTIVYVGWLPMYTSVSGILHFSVVYK